METRNTLAGRPNDFTAQAFGGMMNLMGNPEPDPADPGGALDRRLHHRPVLYCGRRWLHTSTRKRTGEGQVIDLAQFEAVHRILSGTMVAYHELGLVRERAGNKAGNAQPWGHLPGPRTVGLSSPPSAPAVYARVCRVLDLDPDEEKWIKARREVNSPEGHRVRRNPARLGGRPNGWTRWSGPSTMPRSVAAGS